MIFQFENGLEIQKTRISTEVIRSGFYVDHIDANLPTKSRHATVGFHRLGLPEILVRGVPFDCAQQALSGLFLAAQIGLAELATGSRLDELFDREVYFTNISHELKKTEFLASRLYHEHWNFDVLEMCLGQIQRKGFESATTSSYAVS
ncbi:DUF4262 domain-containing protein [Zhongshania marina]|nr:DUF4262 domain-containing protein [Marortus luteolus]